MEKIMSKKSAKINKKPEKKKQKEWPVVVYMWTFGLALLGYLIVGEGIFELRPHPIHWLAGLIGGLAGIPLGWLWYRWRGDVF
jgi:hypothetical protein